MSLTLFKREWKASWKLLAIFLAVLSLYGGMIVSMFDPKLGESLNMMAESMPQIFAAFPPIVQSIFASNSIAVAFVVACAANFLLPKDAEEA